MNNAERAAVWDLKPVSTWPRPWGDLLQISGSPAVRMSKLHTEAEKITACADEKESNFFHPSKSSHTEWTLLHRKYKWGVCLSRWIWLCLCAEGQTNILPLPLRLPCWRQWLTALIKDCEGELSDRTQVTTAEGYPSVPPLNAASFKLPQLRQILHNRGKNTGKPFTGLLFVTKVATVSVQSPSTAVPLVYENKKRFTLNIPNPSSLWNLSSLGKFTCLSPVETETCSS